VTLADTPIYDITPFSLLDYPEHLSCIVWFGGCNMRCSYCYNSEVVFSQGNISVDSLLGFLQRRKGKLEAVVLSGGEATQYLELVGLCASIKALGFKIKLDTNGTNPDMLAKLIELKLIDYVALDYKAPREKFYMITKNKNFDTFLKSLIYLLTCKIDYEVRTTLHNDLLDEEDINAIIRDLGAKGYNKNYYIQEVQLHTKTLGSLQPPIKSFDKNSLCDKLNIVYRGKE
jgi:pyruvate formate lyase activating enzyme